MMYFHSLPLLATLACAGLTIASPLGASDLTLLATSDSGVSTPTFPGVAPVLRDVAHSTPPEVFKEVISKVNSITDKLRELSFPFLFLSWLALNMRVLC